MGGIKGAGGKLSHGRKVNSVARSKLNSFELANLENDLSPTPFAISMARTIESIALTQNNDLLQSSRILRDERDHYLDLFEFAPVPYFMLSTDSKITEVNVCGAALLGFERSKVLNQSFGRFLAADSLESFNFYRSRIGRMYEQQSFEVKIKRKEGSSRHVHVDMNQVHNRGNDAWRLVLTDMTRTNHVEEVSRNNANYLDSIINNAHVPIVVWDTMGKITRVNDALEHLTGLDSSQLVGQSIGQLFLNVIPLSYPGFGKKNKSDLKDSNHNLEFFDIVMQHTSGTARVVSWSCTNIYEADGKTLLASVAQGWDITEHKHEEQMLLEARHHLEGQVEHVAAELTHVKEESEEVNTALRVLMRLRGTENAVAKGQLIMKIKQEIMPFLQRLQVNSQNIKQSHLLNTLDTNLQRLIASYSEEEVATSSFKSLTPKETQVAAMVRDGHSTKAIAKALSLSSETINIHRKNIRRKLGLDSKSDSLRSFLLSIEK